MQAFFEIDGYGFQVSHLPAREGFHIGSIVAKTVLRMVAVAKGNGEPEAVLEKAVSAVLDNLAEADWERAMGAFARKTKVRLRPDANALAVDPNIGAKMPFVDLTDHYDLVFQGAHARQVEWLARAAQFEFASFFADMQSGKFASLLGLANETARAHSSSNPTS